MRFQGVSYEGDVSGSGGYFIQAGSLSKKRIRRGIPMLVAHSNSFVRNGIPFARGISQTLSCIRCIPSTGFN